MRNIDDVAGRLLAVVQPHAGRERIRGIEVAIGAGEPFEAILEGLYVASQLQIPLPSSLVESIEGVLISGGPRVQEDASSVRRTLAKIPRLTAA